jgi:hypothetical protein
MKPRLGALLTLSFLCFGTGTGFAQDLYPTNWGFEAGDLSDWGRLTGPIEVVTSHATVGGTAYTYLPPEGSRFAKLTGQCNNFETFMQRTVLMKPNEKIGGSAAFDANDAVLGTVNDSARVRITAIRFTPVGDAWYSDVVEVGNYEHGPWEQWSYTMRASSLDELHTFTYAVRNAGINSSGCTTPVSYGLFDAAGDPDADDDSVVDSSDNCPTVPNADQANNDGDAQGDVCDADDDNDGVIDGSDNCAFEANPSQADQDNDGQGNVCDGDDDSDGIDDAADNCPFAPNTDQVDTDGDGEGDACDADDDNDGAEDDEDNCPVTANDQSDLDADNIGDACDADIDGDGYLNDEDTCPLASDDQTDTDGDGDGDACDADDDGDGDADDADNCPLVANADQTDFDADGFGDACDEIDDSDVDADGVPGETDNCPTVANPTQADSDGDGEGDACEPDDDGDGVLDSSDICPFTEAGDIVDPSNGCSLAQQCPCAGPRGTTSAWRNHGQYVSCVAQASNRFVGAGLITQAEKDALQSGAGQSSCGHR